MRNPTTASCREPLCMFATRVQSFAGPSYRVQIRDSAGRWASPVGATLWSRSAPAEREAADFHRDHRRYDHRAPRERS